MELNKLSKRELLEQCEKLGITRCKTKNKSDLITLISQKMLNEKKTKHNLIIEDNEEVIETNVHGDEPLKFIDLFCGIGGFHQALTKIGCKCVFASDIDVNCQKTYEINYGIKPEGDITKINIHTIPSFDILCGGFPCQPFSKAGFQKGFEDDRGNLFFNICNVVKHHKPKYMILENVRNLASHDEGNTWKVIKENIRQLGYYTYDDPVLLNVLHFNIPQNRERVVIMCKRHDMGELPKLPEIVGNPKVNLTCQLKDIIENDDNGTEKLTEKNVDVKTIWNSFIQILDLNLINIPKFPIWTDWWDNDFDEHDPFYLKYTSWIDKNREFYKTYFNLLHEWLIQSRQNKNWLGAVRKFEWQAGDLTSENNSLDKCLWTARGSGIRVKKCDYIPTLVAMSMIPIYGPKNRKLTPIELLKLQSFNPEFKYNKKHIYKQLGNAVNVKMIERCALFLIYGKELI